MVEAKTTVSNEIMTKRIIIVEDEAIIAQEIKSSLQIFGYQVVGHAMNGDKALDLFANTKADLILLDISLKGTLTGIDLAKIIRTKYQIPFIYITSYSDRVTLDLVKETNPYGYIVKPFNDNDLKVNVELALYKHEQENASVNFSKEIIEKKLGIELTDREFSLLQAIKDGLTYKEAGERLFISVNTIKTYQKRLFTLFNVKSKFELLQKIN